MSEIKNSRLSLYLPLRFECNNLTWWSLVRLCMSASIDCVLKVYEPDILQTACGNFTIFTTLVHLGYGQKSTFVGSVYTS